MSPIKIILSIYGKLRFHRTVSFLYGAFASLEMFVKLHRSYRTVFAVCDSNLLGKKFEEGERVLDVRENFYKGDEMDYDKVVELMRKEANEDATFNIVGEEAVRTAFDAGIVVKGSEMTVDGVPFVLVLI